MTNVETKKLSNIEKFNASLTPEQKLERKEKLAQARREAAARKRKPVIDLRMVSAVDLIKEYLSINLSLTGNGEPSLDYCRICVGTGVHGPNTPCPCVCHKARKFLASLSESGTPITQVN